MAPIPAASTTEVDPTLFHTERISQYVSLPAASLTSAHPAICASVFSPLLLTYYPPARGVVLAYTDVSLSSSPPPPASSKKRRHLTTASPETAQDPSPRNGQTVLLHQTDEYTAPFLWATASLLIWRPHRNARIPASVTHQSSTHVTLSYLNLFAVTVLRKDMPEQWTWFEESAGKKRKGWDGRIEDAGGWWVDADGARVFEAQPENRAQVQVWVKEWDARPGGGKGKGFLKIEGSFLENVEESR